MLLLVDRLYRYAEDSGDKVSIDFLQVISEQIKTGTFSIASTYYGGYAGDWAYNNYNKYNSNFPAFDKWGSDCTNFVSQAMHLGGKKAMSGNWYVYKKNSTYLHPTSATQLNYSWRLSDPSPWISVDQFRNYWKPKSIVHTMSNTYYHQNHASVYNRNITKGDVVIFSKGVSGWVTSPTHVMIISRYDSTNRDFLLAGHSYNRQARPLLTAIDSYSSIEILEIP